MAKTIEEYAEEYGRNRCKINCDDFNECFACEESLKCREYYCKVETYIEIATEQRKRDIEKAWNFFVTTLGDKHNKVPINTGEVDEEGYPIWVYEHEDDFYERLKIAMKD